jgi:hypothetical protein
LPRDKQLLISESRGDLNRCTPYRGNLINMPHTFHAQFVWPSSIRISRGPCISTFCESSTGFDRCTAPEKSAPNSTSQPGWVAHRTRLSFSPNTTTKVVCLSQAPVDSRLLSLLSPYHQHAISTLNTCTRGPTHQSLTDIGEGYNLRGAGFPHHTPWLFQPMVLHFPPNSPARSPVINQIPIELEMKQTLNLTSGSLHLISTVSYHLCIARANDEPPR